ncbi:MAG: branched-chain amino acid aminotransferase [Alphaproteobacteria bacterium]|nr:branched-chain amino acid aminotransferase [Alphaproteobacteria bacterium]
MAAGTNIHTYFEGTWHKGNVPIMRAADHGAWLGSTVFDGARFFEGIFPDLLAHCERVNHSATALGINPTVSASDIMQITLEGLKLFPKNTPVYIRPMYWGIDSGLAGILPDQDKTGFCICLEEIPMATPEATTTLTTTQFHRPVLADSVVNAKAGCLYPNNARMLREAKDKGFANALVADALGNVAESASANVFMAKDGELFTPVANGTFLAGITRARHMTLLRGEGITVHETVLGFDDFRGADEVFLSGNMTKITPVTAFDDTHYQHGPISKMARELYWDWAHSGNS